VTIEVKSPEISHENTSFLLTSVTLPVRHSRAYYWDNLVFFWLTVKA